MEKTNQLTDFHNRTPRSQDVEEIPSVPLLQDDLPWCGFVVLNTVREMAQDFLIHPCEEFQLTHDFVQFTSSRHGIRDDDLLEGLPIHTPQNAIRRSHNGRSSRTVVEKGEFTETPTAGRSGREVAEMKKKWSEG